ncbi:hypothetical protein JYU34_001778, partial [Plutella xylostella]
SLLAMMDEDHTSARRTAEDRWRQPRKATVAPRGDYDDVAPNEGTEQTNPNTAGVDTGSVSHDADGDFLVCGGEGLGFSEQERSHAIEAFGARGKESERAGRPAAIRHS